MAPLYGLRRTVKMRSERGDRVRWPVQRGPWSPSESNSDTIISHPKPLSRFLRAHPMNKGKLLRDRLRAGSTCLGTFNTSSDPCITELLCGSGYEFIVIDAEHGALNIETVQACIIAAKGTSDRNL